MAPASHPADHEQIRAAVTAATPASPGPHTPGSRSPTAILAPLQRAASVPPVTPTPASCPMPRCGPASALSCFGFILAGGRRWRPRCGPSTDTTGTEFVELTHAGVVKDEGQGDVGRIGCPLKVEAWGSARRAAVLVDPPNAGVLICLDSERGVRRPRCRTSRRRAGVGVQIGHSVAPPIRHATCRC